MTQREKQQCSLSAFMEDFQEQLAKILRHLFDSDSVDVIHIDFSENC